MRDEGMGFRDSFRRLVARGESKTTTQNAPKQFPKKYAQTAGGALDLEPVMNDDDDRFEIQSIILSDCCPVNPMVGGGRICH